MTQTISAALLILGVLIQPAIAFSQATTSQQQRGQATSPTPSAPQTPPTAAPQRGAPTAQPQRGQRAAARPTMPMTLRQVIESLITLKNSSRVEEQISKAGVRFQATPGVLDT